MNRKRLLLAPLCGFILMLGVITACASSPRSSDSPPVPAQSPLPLPSETDAAALLQERCSTCHSLERVQNAQKTAAQWEQTVDRMIGKGAKLNNEERAILIAYLAEQYGP